MHHIPPGVPFDPAALLALIFVACVLGLALVMALLISAMDWFAEMQIGPGARVAIALCSLALGALGLWVLAGL